MSLLRDLHRGGWLRDVDHALATSLQRLDPDTPDEVLAAVALASRAVANGHSCLRIEGVSSLLNEIAPERPAPALPTTPAWMAMLQASRWIGAPDDGAGNPRKDDRLHGVPLVLERGGLFLRRYRDYEWRLATALRTRASTPPVQDIDDRLAARLRELFPAQGDTLDMQALAAVLALSSRLSLITGGPGTGKTSAIARVLVLLAERSQHAGHGPPRIALAAPTGKAAARLAEAVRENLATLVERGVVGAEMAAALPTDAQTLHRLLGWRANSIDFRHDAQHPLDADVVIVDEASMVDLPLMTKLVEAVRADATLILLGDRDQLASVETGDVLAALCDAAGDGRAFPVMFAQRAMALLDAPVPIESVPIESTPIESAPIDQVPIANDETRSMLAGHRIDLHRSYRQASGFDLAPLATAVRDGDVDATIEALRTRRYPGVRWQQHGDDGLADHVREYALPRFRTVIAAADPAHALTLARDYRVLTALRHGPAGSQTLNAMIAIALNPHRGDALFHGQLLIVSENSYRHGLFNGDTGVVWRDDDGLRVWFETGEGLRAWLPSQLPANESAWALTVHKAQGSEFGEVLLALPEHDARVLSRELVYTGITRSRRGLELWATEAVLRNAIGRRGRRESGLAQRFTLREHSNSDTASR
jgi:exodeoxyribonuclease V alpha subunit